MIWYVDGEPAQLSQDAAVSLGMQGENNVTRYTADLNDWLTEWPDGIPILMLSPPGCGGDPYMGNTSFDKDTGIVTWTVTEFDTAQSGYGYGELRLVSQDVVKKSYRITTYVYPSVISCAGDPPAPAPDWANDLADQVSQAAQATGENAEAAQAAQAAAEEAAQAAETSADRAEQAAQEAGYMDFYIDDNGHLIYQRTDNLDIDFELREGSLIAIWQ